MKGMLVAAIVCGAMYALLTGFGNIVRGIWKANKDAGKATPETLTIVGGFARIIGWTAGGVMVVLLATDLILAVAR